MYKREVRKGSGRKGEKKKAEEGGGERKRRVGIREER